MLRVFVMRRAPGLQKAGTEGEGRARKNALFRMQDRVIQMKGKKKHKGLKIALGVVGGLLLALVLTFVTPS